MVSGQRIYTGTGPDRRRMTWEEASAGCVPQPFTKDEWAAMYRASDRYMNVLLEAHLHRIR